MNLGDLVPWNRRERGLAPRDRGDAWEAATFSPMMRLHQEMNRLFEDAFRGFDTPALWGRQWPSVEVQETDNGYRVTAELPGLEEKDVDVSFQDGVLTIRGEKRAETENRDRTVSERYYGRFERRLALPDIDDSKAHATFRNGVLTIDLPRVAEAQERIKRIPINTGDRIRH